MKEYVVKDKNIYKLQVIKNEDIKDVFLISQNSDIHFSLKKKDDVYKELRKRGYKKLTKFSRIRSLFVGGYNELIRG